MITIARLSTALVLLAGTARAQTTDTLGWHFVASLGYVQTSGNTQLSTVNLADKLVYHPAAAWTFTQTATWIYGKSGGAESANQMLGSLRADRAVSARLTAFGQVDGERNTFAGVEHRFAELVGLSWAAVKTPKHTLAIDVGAGNTQELTGGASVSYWVARVAPKYRYAITDKAYFEENLEIVEDLANTGDLRTTSSSALVAPLMASIAIRLGLLLRHVAQPPLNTGVTPNVPFRKLDTTFTSGIQLTL